MRYILKMVIILKNVSQDKKINVKPIGYPYTFHSIYVFTKQI